MALGRTRFRSRMRAGGGGATPVTPEVELMDDDGTTYLMDDDGSTYLTDDAA